MPILKILTGPRAGVSHSFESTLVLGRGAEPDLSLHHSTVSRRHAQLARTADGWVAVDLGSAIGTYLDEQLLGAPTVVHDGDILRLGAITVELADVTVPAPAGRADAAAADAERVPAPTPTVDGAAPPEIRLAMDAVSLAPAGGLRVADEPLAQRVRLLIELASDLSQMADEAAILGHLAERLFVALPQAERLLVLLRDERGDELVPRLARNRAGASVEIGLSRTLLRRVVDERQALLSADVQRDERFAQSDSVARLRLRSVACVPLLAPEGVLGVVQADSSRGDSVFDEGDVLLLLGVARQAALALTNLRLRARLLEKQAFDHDLQLARKIQAAFLPRETPHVAGLGFAVSYTPAMAVGGDFYDFFELPAGRVGITIGDVSGKGVSAALYMARVSSELRLRAVGRSEPADILRQVNDALAEANEEGMFVTALVVSLDPASGDFSFASAGHHAPLVRRASGATVQLTSPGDSPLGLARGADFVRQEEHLGPGDSFVLYTDGVTEAMCPSRALFGAERLAALLRTSPAAPEAQLARIRDAVRTFVDGGAQSDDITLVCCRSQVLH
jgi:phosphoserine phosphatase RsbU/P